MARIPRIMITGEPTAYHIMSRTALEGYPMDDVDKDFFVEQVVKLSKLFFVEVFGLVSGSDQAIILIFMGYRSKNRCFPYRYRCFRGQNGQDRELGALEARVRHLIP